MNSGCAQSIVAIPMTSSLHQIQRSLEKREYLLTKERGEIAQFTCTVSQKAQIPSVCSAHIYEISENIRRNQLFWLLTTHCWHVHQALKAWRSQISTLHSGRRCLSLPSSRITTANGAPYRFFWMIRKRSRLSTVARTYATIWLKRCTGSLCTKTVSIAKGCPPSHGWFVTGQKFYSTAPSST